MTSTRFRAVILDLDGVLTRTAVHHAKSWKETFDDFLAHRTAEERKPHEPFEIERDYLRYVDGKPRLDGVRSFLASRGIEIPEGLPDDAAEAETVHGLGTRKNRIFLRRLEREPVEVFPDTVEQIRRWRDQGMATALITSSRNGGRILETAGLQELFDVKVDGNDSARMGIPGKPAPDIFLAAARQLGVEPSEAIVVEDAIAGVEAGRAGGFGLVVGVARVGGDQLRAAGADIVVSDLRELRSATAGPPDEPVAQPYRPSALENIDRFVGRTDRPRLALFLDYDGTLTPIVRRPEDATLTEEMRSLLRELSGRITVAIVSGRDLADVRAMVRLENLHFAGSHGFDVACPGGRRMEQEEARERLPDLDAAEREIRDRLEEIDGSWVERKHFAIAIHYREASEPDAARVEAAVDEVHRAHARLRKQGGKKIFELQPNVHWHKGRAVHWLVKQMGLDRPDVLPIYVGDDVTDENAFRELSGHGVGIRVGSPDEPTHADYSLHDTDEVRLFLETLLKRIPEGGDHG